MAFDRVPVATVGGLLSPWIGDAGDLVAAVSVGSATLKRLFLHVPEAPSSAAIVASIRTASSGGGSGIQATIPIGAKSGVGTGSVVLSGSETLYLRVESAGAEAADLSGWFELETADGTVVISALTNTTRVKRYLSEAGTSLDVNLNELILSVSKAMQNWMQRLILERAISNEKHDGNGVHDVLNLRHYPVTAASVTVDVDGVALDAGDFEVEEEPGQVYYKPDGTFAPWPKGRRNLVFDYSSGYDSVPEDLEHAATLQVLYEFKKTAAGGGRVGERQTTVGDGINVYMVDAWVPEVLAIMQHYRRAA